MKCSWQNMESGTCNDFFLLKCMSKTINKRCKESLQTNIAALMKNRWVKINDGFCCLLHTVKNQLLKQAIKFIFPRGHVEVYNSILSSNQKGKTWYFSLKTYQIYEKRWTKMHSNVTLSSSRKNQTIYRTAECTELVSLYTEIDFFI